MPAQSKPLKYQNQITQTERTREIKIVLGQKGAVSYGTICLLSSDNRDGMVQIINWNVPF